MNSIKIYKIARKLYLKKVPFIPKILYKIIFIMYNSIIPFECSIGDGSRLSYGGIGVVIHPKASIGKNVIIGSGVTIGGNFNNKIPSIGDNCYIAPGAKILGATIGNNVIIGANSVVTKDVKDNVVVNGNPALVTHEVELHNSTKILEAKLIKIR